MAATASSGGWSTRKVVAKLWLVMAGFLSGSLWVRMGVSGGGAGEGGELCSRALKSPFRPLSSMDPDIGSKKTLNAAALDTASGRVLREDAIVEMPPFDLWLRGREDTGQWLAAGEVLRDHVVVLVSANGSPAFAHYRSASPGGFFGSSGMNVGDRAGMTCGFSL
jgi:hypothetical protein